MPSAHDFRDELFRMIRDAQRAGNQYVEVEAGELHKRVGGYPGRDHRMPSCGGAMKAEVSIEGGDAVMSEGSRSCWTSSYSDNLYARLAQGAGFRAACRAKPAMEQLPADGTPR
jgi:hypothetical protein